MIVITNEMWKCLELPQDEIKLKYEKFPFFILPHIKKELHRPLMIKTLLDNIIDVEGERIRLEICPTKDLIQMIHECERDVTCDTIFIEFEAGDMGPMELMEEQSDFLDSLIEKNIIGYDDLKRIDFNC